MEKDKRLIEASWWERLTELEIESCLERLAISSRKLEKPREYFMQRCAQKGKKWQGPNRNRGD